MYGGYNDHYASKQQWGSNDMNCGASSSNAIRCVLVGDACVGKTSLIVAYTTNGFSDHYTPTAFDNYSVTVNIDEKPLKLELCDTAGRSEFNTIRTLSYADANVFLLCFSTVRPNSLNSVTERWIPELRAISPTAPIILVGTQSDLKFSRLAFGYSAKSQSPVDAKLISRIAEKFHVEYIECSAITHQNLKEVFDLAILYGLKRRKIPSEKIKSPRNSSSILRNNANKDKSSVNKKQVGKKLSSTHTTLNTSASSTIRGLISKAANAGRTEDEINGQKNSSNGKLNGHGINKICVNAHNGNVNNKSIKNDHQKNGNSGHRNNNNNDSNYYNSSKFSYGNYNNTATQNYSNSDKKTKNYYGSKRINGSYCARQPLVNSGVVQPLTFIGGCENGTRTDRNKPIVPATTIKEGFRKLVSMTKRFL